MIPAPGILLTAIALLVAALSWAAWRGDDARLVWMLAGAGSITLGVWLGVAVTRPPGLLTGRDDRDEP